MLNGFVLLEEVTGEGDVEHAVDAGNVTLEIVLAAEEAAADVAGEARRQSALVPHVTHQVVVGGVGAAALRTHVTALVVGRVLLLARRTGTAAAAAAAAATAHYHRRRCRFLRAYNKIINRGQKLSQSWVISVIKGQNSSSFWFSRSNTF